MASTDLKFRPRPDQRAWLDHERAANNRSMNGEISAIIDAAMRENPLQIAIHQCQAEGGEWFAVSVGSYGDDFHETTSKEAALIVAHSKARELGLPRSSVVLVKFADLKAETPNA